MTPKQQRFVQEYLVDLNATQAAKRAGYAQPQSQGPRLLQNVEICNAVRREQEKLGAAAGITAEKVIRELALLGFSNMQDYMRSGPGGDPYLDFSKLTRDQAAALVEVTVEDFKDGRGEDARDVRRVRFKLADKRAALVDLGKHLGLFVDKKQVEHTGAEGGPIRHEYVITDAVRALLEEATTGLADVPGANGAVKH